MGLSISKLNEIEAYYSRRRLFHEKEQHDHISLVYRVVPRINDIDDEIITLSADQAKKNVLGIATGKAEYLMKLEALSAEKNALLSQYEFPEDFLELKYDCSICRDTGADGNRRCRCFTNLITQKLYESSGLSDVLKKENFDTFRLDLYPSDDVNDFHGVSISSRRNMESVLKSCMEYTDNFDKNKGNLLFTGPAGRGKTFMTNCIASELISKGFSVVYQTSAQFFDGMKQKTFSYSVREDNELLSAFYMDADLLIIDDLGSELTNAFTNSALFECINERLLKGLGTIISTNFTLKQIRDTYSDRIYSRLMGNYITLPFVGRDLRLI